jgi:tRNA pseudouridine55 synthase
MEAMRPNALAADRGAPQFDGFLVVDKPAGWTSHDVVARLRRMLGQRRIGHAGTLDPAATGVLPIAVGSATRVVEFLAAATKAYVGEVSFGVQTDSYDADGVVIEVRDASALAEAEVEAALTRFRGTFAQLPPMHSARKVGGRRLYEMARREEEIEREARQVTISALTLLEWSPPVATLFVDCSKGTYIRTLAHDLGVELGVGAHLSGLVRVRSGPFTLCDAWTIDDLAGTDLVSSWPEVAFHPDGVLVEWPALILDENGVKDWTDGKILPSTTPAGGLCRVYDSDGAWLGVGRAEGERAWRPHKVVVNVDRA